MQYLLDTHAVLWALLSPEKLSDDARRVIVARSSVVVVSAVSAWEISTKQRIGKLPHAEGLVLQYAVALDRLGVDRLAITDEHALLSGGLAWSHRDPFDRILAAQALSESMTLITVDATFQAVDGLRTLW
ncbi:type II toxin-antitoxin system VapC family toxin [Microbacterium sp.]|uniref:type II toxin-antitoxin system VapC family toxin n=1 Tax=Microbacterium sp. TaxID=51671 RepID=UPI0039E38812